jgi:ABC-2 type transport system permease protein
MRYRGFLQLVRIQATMLRRNIGFWLPSIMIAVISILVFGWLFNPGSQPVEMAIVDEDRTDGSASLVAAFERVESLDTHVGERARELEALDEGDLEAVVIIPAGFEKDLPGGGASVEALYDDSDPIEIGYVTTAVAGVVARYNRDVVGATSGVTIEERSVATEGVQYIDFLTPGMVGMTIMYVNLGVGFLLVTWREQGILRRLGVTPLRPGSLIASQALSFALVSLTQVTIILGLGHFAFDVSLNGSLLLLAFTVVLGVATMLSIGYLLGSFIRGATAVNAIVNAVAFPMLFLGGSYFPLEAPAALAPLVDAIPLTHLNRALRELVNGSGDLGELWLPWTVLAAWVVAGFTASVRAFRWQ